MGHLEPRQQEEEEEKQAGWPASRDFVGQLGSMGFVLRTTGSRCKVLTVLSKTGLLERSPGTNITR